MYAMRRKCPLGTPCILVIFGPYIVSPLLPCPLRPLLYQPNAIRNGPILKRSSLNLISFFITVPRSPSTETVSFPDTSVSDGAGSPLDCDCNLVSASTATRLDIDLVSNRVQKSIF